MTTVLALSMVGLRWLAAGTTLWGIFVALGLRFETRREAVSERRPRGMPDRCRSYAAEVARS